MGWPCGRDLFHPCVGFIPFHVCYLGRRKRKERKAKESGVCERTFTQGHEVDNA